MKKLWTMFALLFCVGCSAPRFDREIRDVAREVGVPDDVTVLAGETYGPTPGATYCGRTVVFWHPVWLPQSWRRSLARDELSKIATIYWFHDHLRPLTPIVQVLEATHTIGAGRSILSMIRGRREDAQPHEWTADDGPVSSTFEGRR